MACYIEWKICFSNLENLRMIQERDISCYPHALFQINYLIINALQISN